jgi:hypothetical protein
MPMGLFGPAFFWEEPEHRDRASPCFQGGYWPPEAPAIQFKAMKLKPDSVRPYFLSRDRLAESEARIVANYRFFGPFHRAFGSARMTAFDWLDGNRLVQRTTFDGGLELIANFSDKALTSAVPWSLFVGP